MKSCFLQIHFLNWEKNECVKVNITDCLQTYRTEMMDSLDVGELIPAAEVQSELT